MKQNAAVSIGSLALIDKINDEHQFFPRLFGGLGGKAKKINNTKYECVKAQEENGTQYIFYSKKLFEDQTKKRNKKFERELQKNESKLVKVKKNKILTTYISKEGYILAKGSIQKSLDEIKNPYITGLEGYFILESSVDEEPEKILKLYKEKDKAEKLIRNMKEGTEL